MNCIKNSILSFEDKVKKKYQQKKFFLNKNIQHMETELRKCIDQFNMIQSQILNDQYPVCYLIRANLVEGQKEHSPQFLSNELKRLETGVEGLNQKVNILKLSQNSMKTTYQQLKNQYVKQKRIASELQNILESRPILSSSQQFFSKAKLQPNSKTNDEQVIKTKNNKNRSKSIPNLFSKQVCQEFQYFDEIKKQLKQKQKVLNKLKIHSRIASRSYDKKTEKGNKQSSIVSRVTNLKTLHQFTPNITKTKKKRILQTQTLKLRPSITLHAYQNTKGMIPEQNLNTKKKLNFLDPLITTVDTLHKFDLTQNFRKNLHKLSSEQLLQILHKTGLINEVIKIVEMEKSTYADKYQFFKKVN